MTTTSHTPHPTRHDSDQSGDQPGDQPGAESEASPRPHPVYSELPTWVQIDAEVASLTRGRHRWEAVRFARVESVNARRITLDNGEEFPTRTLTRREGDLWEGRDVRLFSATDDLVTRVHDELAHAALKDHAQAVANLYAFPGQLRDPRPTEADLILALAPLTGVAEEIRALFE